MPDAVGEFNFECLQGATFHEPVLWEDDNDEGVVLDGRTARMQVRPTVSSDELEVELTTENDRITFDEDVVGQLWLTIDADTTAALDAGQSRNGKKYYYDLEIEDPDGFVVRLIQGEFKIFPEVTRPQSEEA